MRQFLGGQILQTPPLPSGNLVNRTIIVTGANTGLGYECAKHLLVSPTSSVGHILTAAMQSPPQGIELDNRMSK